MSSDVQSEAAISSAPARLFGYTTRPIIPLDIHPDLPLDSVPRQQPGYTVEKIPCCYLLRHEDHDNIVKLNMTGFIIWQTCTREWTVGEIIDVLKEAYPDAANDMDKDVFRALDNLQDEGLITLDYAVNNQTASE